MKTQGKSLSRAKENFNETKREFYVQTATLVNSAFALVAALAWNEAIKAVIDEYIPRASAIASKLGYAAILTIIVVIVSMRLSTIIKRYKPEEESDKK